ncbi:MAG TPA: DivIVA domain-containing protein [Acidimicrobiia bacterium]|jgi:cell division septum initiation protein DivIVA
MDVTPHELRDCQISDAFRGYSRDEVNELMERAAATIETQGEKIRILTERVSSVTTDAARTRDNDDIIQRTMVLAQRAADDAIADASRQAAEMLSDADSRSRAMVDAANDEVHRVHDVERARLDAEIRDLAARRDAMHNDVEALESWEREYRGRVIGQLEADLATARAKKAITPTAPPTARTDATEQLLARPVASAPAPAPATPAPATPAPAPQVVAEPQTVTASASDIDLTRDREQARQEPVEVVEAVPVSAGIAVAKPLRPQGQTAPQAASAPTPAPTKSAPQANAQPGQDARLDDDAFFATLRDAVRDDAPLGPADDRLFDSDRDSSLRDIFKRRR